MDSSGDTHSTSLVTSHGPRVSTLPQCTHAARSKSSESCTTMTSSRGRLSARACAVPGPCSSYPRSTLQTPIRRWERLIKAARRSTARIRSAGRTRCDGTSSATTSAVQARQRILVRLCLLLLRPGGALQILRRYAEEIWSPTTLRRRWSTPRGTRTTTSGAITSSSGSRHTSGRSTSLRTLYT